MCYLIKMAQTPEELAALCKTPERLERWVNSLNWLRGVHRSPKTDTRRNPIVVLHCMEGNSLEIAWLLRDTMHHLGYDCYIISVHEEGAASDQVLCTFQKDKEFWYISNKGIKRTKTNKLEDIPKLLHTPLDNWKEWAVINGKMRRVKTHTIDGGNNGR